MSTRLIIKLLLIISCSGLLACSAPDPGFNATEIGPVDWGGDFSLIDHDGKTFSSQALNGKVVILFFGFTHCPDICSPTLMRLAALRKSLGQQGQALQVLFISVDPTHDTPEQLKSFLAQFDTSFIGLTGEPQQIDTVIKQYKVAVAKGEQQSLTDISHTGGVFVKDRGGRLRLYMAEDMTPAAMRDDIKRLLQEG